MPDSKTHTITLKGNMNEPWLVLGAETVDGLEAALHQAFPLPEFDFPTLAPIATTVEKKKELVPA